MKYEKPLNSELYQEANPQAGIQRSIPPILIYESLQKEIENVIKNSGIVPSSSVFTQLSDAIKNLILQHFFSIEITPNLGETITLTANDLPEWCKKYPFYMLVYGQITQNGTTYSTEFHDAVFFSAFYRTTFTYGENCQILFRDIRTTSFIEKYKINEYVETDSEAAWFKYPVKYTLLLFAKNN